MSTLNFLGELSSWLIPVAFLLAFVGGFATGFVCHAAARERATSFCPDARED